MKVIEKINLIKKFRSKLNKKYVLSGWMQICSPEIAEILSKKTLILLLLILNMDLSISTDLMIFLEP